ncbi:hypothetical protein DS2_16764 [Catenovulum agarivorans DS-2]|uniref:Uncharacterized protein n=1 Tax=Catenovulum agarivorans DS-2 TaxID=1328313 RepID=W7QHZ4_9ALTE|nr:hypothetical protein [Catenovulum agarivorans]EWH08547.1 hypothetical protein DS2_16764 [Catenovulum agarivorans DS-2]
MDKTPQNHIEWQTLQQAYDKYEFGSLVIKLLAVVLTVAGIAATMQLCWLLAIVAILWLQDGIWKTFQSRFEVRLLQIERQLADNTQTTPAFNSDWQQQRPGAVGLVKAYIANSLKPTVMYPYVVLMVLIGLSYVFSA